LPTMPHYGGAMSVIEDQQKAPDVVLAPSLPARVRALISWETLRYGVSGTASTLLYIVLTLLLEGPGSLPIQAAIPLAYALALVFNFTLQRTFVFPRSEGFALAPRSQLVRYVGAVLVQYAITATATAKVPGWLDVPERDVYVVTVLCLAVCAFLTLRAVVFHAADA
jgi:putative flippase GtrA